MFISTSYICGIYHSLINGIGNLKHKHLLRETHSIPNDERFWQNEWGGQIIFFVMGHPLAEVFVCSLVLYWK